MANNPFGNPSTRFPELEPTQQQQGYVQQPYQPQSTYQPQLYQQPPSMQLHQQQQYYQPSTQDLDPYSALSTSTAFSPPSFSPQLQQPQQQPQQQLQQQSNQVHPRQFVQIHKLPLTQFHAPTWTLLLASVDVLRKAWEDRLKLLVELRDKGGDSSIIGALYRTAESNIDGIHASHLQLSEVQQGWQISSDATSKLRVRENLNAGIQSLPEFPAPLQPGEVGGMLERNEAEGFRKQAILEGFQGGYGGGYAGQGGYGQGYGQQQQQPPQQLQGQMTGYPGMQFQQQGYGPAQNFGAPPNQFNQTYYQG